MLRSCNMMPCPEVTKQQMNDYVLDVRTQGPGTRLDNMCWSWSQSAECKATAPIRPPQVDQ